MLSFALRRVFNGRSHRWLSTSVVSEAASSSLAPVTVSMSNGPQLIQAVPLSKPVYVAMSHLVPPTIDTPLDEVAELDPFIFSHPIRRDILHLCVVQYLDSLRQGTACTKTRGEVRGSGAKVRPQKRSGKARLGDGQSPMLRGGGVAFGPKPRDFSTKLPRKVVATGFRAALSVRVKEQGLGIVRTLDWPDMKTRTLASRLDELGWRKSLLVTGEQTVSEGLRRASGNLYKVETKAVSDVTVYDLVKWPRVVLDIAAVEWLERTLAREPHLAVVS